MLLIDHRGERKAKPENMLAPATMAERMAELEATVASQAQRLAALEALVRRQSEQIERLEQRPAAASKDASKKSNGGAPEVPPHPEVARHLSDSVKQLTDVLEQRFRESELFGDAAPPSPTSSAALPSEAPLVSTPSSRLRLGVG